MADYKTFTYPQPTENAPTVVFIGFVVMVLLAKIIYPGFSGWVVAGALALAIWKYDRVMDPPDDDDD